MMPMMMVMYIDGVSLNICSNINGSGIDGNYYLFGLCEEGLALNTWIHMPTIPIVELKNRSLCIVGIDEI